MRPLAVGLAVFVSGCNSCGRNAAELAPDSGFHPTGDAGAGAGESAPASVSARPAARFTPEERRDLRIRIAHEDCERAAKRINVLHNRPETDIKGIDIISICLKNGNMAWYRCVVDAPAADEADRCGQRYLHTAD
jgi:hypothetical protein